MLNTKAVEEELINFLAGNEPNTLGYTDSNNIVPVFITGISKQEEKLPLWHHPIYIESNGRREYLVFDLRRWTRKPSEDKPFETFFRSQATSTLGVLRTLLTQAAIGNDFKKFITLNSTVSSMFGRYISTVVGVKLDLNAQEQHIVDIVATFHMLCQMTLITSDSELNVNVVKDKISNMKSFNLTADVKLINSVISVDAYRPSFKELTNLITAGLASIGSDITITANILSVAITRTLIGNDSEELVQIAVENPPTWMAIVTTVLVDPWYKKCIIHNVLDKNKRKLFPELFVSDMVLFLKESKQNNNDVSW
jgi:hypothetical protein